MAATGVVQNPAYCEAQHEADDGPAHEAGSTGSAGRTARTHGGGNDHAAAPGVAGSEPTAQDAKAGKAKGAGGSTANPLGLDQETLDVLAAASASDAAVGENCD